MNKLILVIAALLLTACGSEGASGRDGHTGPRGPAGHPGVQGPPGGISKATLAHINNVGAHWFVNAASFLATLETSPTMSKRVLAFASKNKIPLAPGGSRGKGKPRSSK